MANGKGWRSFGPGEREREKERERERERKEKERERGEKIMTKLTSGVEKSVSGVETATGGK